MNQGVKLCFGKFIFDFFIVILLLGYATEGLGGTWSFIDLLISAGALAGLFCMHTKKVFSILLFGKYIFFSLLFGILPIISLLNQEFLVQTSILSF